MLRISARAVIFKDDEVILLYRKRKTDNGYKEYYAIPGGGLETYENVIDCVKRELKEEYGVEIEVIDYLGKVEEDTKEHLVYYAKIKSGTPILGGEESERNSDDNYYEIRYIKVDDLDMYDISNKNKELIRKAYEMKDKE